MITIKTGVNKAKEIFNKMADVEEEDFDFTGLDYIYFQEEQSKLDDWPHLQGMIQMSKRTTENQAKKWFINNDIHEPRYAKKARDAKDCYTYVHKQETKVKDGYVIEWGEFTGHGGKRKRPRSDGSDDEEPEKKLKTIDIVEYFRAGGNKDLIMENLGVNAINFPLNNIRDAVYAERRGQAVEAQKEQAEAFWEDKAYDWQKEIKEIMDKLIKYQDDRSIVCIIGNGGNEGKSTLGKMLWYLNQNERARIQCGKTNDLAMILSSYGDLELVVLDMGRDDPKYFSPRILEQVKDGIIQNNKYQSKVTNLGHPVQCIVLANKHIKWSGCSIDRWTVYDVAKSDFTDEMTLEKWSQTRIEEEWSKSEKEAEELAKRKRERGLDTD